MKKTVLSFADSKKTGNKLSLLTAYDYSAARRIDSCGIDGILVGDSLGMVCLGYKNTLSVTMEDMLHHTRAAARGVEQALLISDMPFMSYQTSVEDAVRNAGRLIQEGGAEAVKLEGGTNVIAYVEAIVKARIPVMGHLGLTPQSVNVLGGFKVQGIHAGSALQLLEEARMLEAAGAFSIVLECIPGEVADLITRAVSIPTIGIGAGPCCDGQILVYHDMLGLYEEQRTKFTKRFAAIGEAATDGIKAYIAEVSRGAFPERCNTFSMPEPEFAKLMSSWSGQGTDRGDRDDRDIEHC